MLSEKYLLMSKAQIKQRKLQRTACYRLGCTELTVMLQSDIVRLSCQICKSCKEAPDGLSGIRIKYKGFIRYINCIIL